MLDGAGGLPVLIPAVGAAAERDLLVERLDGLLITGARTNVGPQHYGGPNAGRSTSADAGSRRHRLPLIREAIETRLPLLAICRGFQELNVALGGTLHQHVHELPGRLDHRSHKSGRRRSATDTRHDVELTPGGRLQALLGGTATIQVNSLHGQAIDRLAPACVVEALAPDGTIEAVSVRMRRHSRSACSGIRSGGCWTIRSRAACSPPFGTPAARAAQARVPGMRYHGAWLREHSHRGRVPGRRHERHRARQDPAGRTSSSSSLVEDGLRLPGERLHPDRDRRLSRRETDS